jgi:hypothetical protein
MDPLTQVPKLLLARQAEDPHSRVAQANLPLMVSATPLRCLGLLKTVRRLQ